MPEQLQKIGNQIIEWWKKYNTKQKALLLSITATIILALVILAVVVGKPAKTVLIQCASTSEAAEVKDVLDKEGIAASTSEDGMIFYVDKKDAANASIVLGKNKIPTLGYDIENVFGSGFTSTEADKSKRYKLYLEERFADHLESLSNVESAYVTINLPPDDGTILANEQESSATVILTLSSEMDADQAFGLAQYIATSLGNKSTENILILDSDSNVLFSGTDTTSVAGTASSQLSLKEKTKSMIERDVKKVLEGSGLFDSVKVAANPDMNFNQRTETSHDYSAPDGRENGMISEENITEESATGGLAGVPGTDTNNGDNTTYVYPDGSYTESERTDTSRKYQNNEKVTQITDAVGTINLATSSIALTTTNYVIYNEDTLRASGALGDMTFEEYIAANSEMTKMDVDPEYITMVANATGFPEENISFTAFQEPVFQYSSGGRSFSDYLQIILAVLIFLLLGYVVFRSTRKDKSAEIEPELSVESLLESTKESQDPKEDIGYNEKSETRVLIEKFVEENPEAAAALLRNWLNEEWE